MPTYFARPFLSGAARILSLAFSIVVAVSGCGHSQSPAPLAATQPSLKFKDCNVIFVSFDALQAAHVGALGYPKDVTPGIDSLAKAGYLFTNAYSVSSWTIPSTMSWFTGVYPSEHRMTNKFTLFNRGGPRKKAALNDVAPELLTLAEIFKQNGYATGGFCGNAGLSGGFGFDKGFDVYFHDTDVFGGFDRSVPRALDWLREHKDRKFFLFLHGYDVHGQYEPPGGFDYRFVDKDYDNRYRGSPREQEVLREEGLEKGHVTLRDSDVRFWRAIYDEKIQRADAHFQRFLKTLAELHLLDNTLFIVTSDHGTEFFEHRRFDHGFTLYEELLHVPLIIKCPGQAIGSAITPRVSSIDLMPTVLDLADLNVPEKARQRLRGVSLVPAIKGQDVRRDIFAETDYREYTYKRCIITPDGWKLIYTLEDHRRELYNLSNDLCETKDLSDQNARKADELQQILFARFRALGHDLTARRWIRGLNPVYDSQGR
jgi:arylsulfatase A-like enzyme